MTTVSFPTGYPESLDFIKIIDLNRYMSFSVGPEHAFGAMRTIHTATRLSSSPLLSHMASHFNIYLLLLEHIFLSTIRQSNTPIQYFSVSLTTP